MNSKEKILYDVAAAQPTKLPMPEVDIQSASEGSVLQFADVLQSIGGKVLEVASRNDVKAIPQEQFVNAKTIIDIAFDDVAMKQKDFDPRSLANVDVVILEASLGVAENGAIWITDSDMVQRVLPFITEHLIVLLPKAALVPTMHDAYKWIGAADYGFGVFIAGPSKTADIEQSLVIGAHGTKSMTVIILNS